MGLSEIDAVLGCPLLLPAQADVGIDFIELGGQKQWTAASCFYHAASWCRELVNSFVHSAAFPAEARAAAVRGEDSSGGGEGGATDASSQEDAPEEVRRKVIEKLKCLVRLEEDLRFTASKCYHFNPPGVTALPPPLELERRNSLDADKMMLEVDAFHDDPSMADGPSNSAKLSKEEKKALKEMQKKLLRSRTAEKKAKQRLLKLQAKYRVALSERSIQALRPLNSLVCLALGFPELSVVAQEPGAAAAFGSQGVMLSLGTSQLRNLSVGGPLSTLLLAQLHKSLKTIFSNGKESSFVGRWGKMGKTPKEGTMSQHLDDLDNPYRSLAVSKSSSSHSNRFKPLETFLAGGVFVSLYEHLATVAEIRGGGDADSDGENLEGRPAGEEDRQKTDDCVRLLFACTTCLMQAEELTSSPKGRQYLEAVMKQLSEGDRETNMPGKFDRSRKQASLTFLRKSLFDVFSNVEEIVMGGETGDLPFTMLGVDCLEAIIGCALRLELVGQVQNRNVTKLRRKMSGLCQSLLQRKWKADTKFNKGNVGRLVSLYIDHSYVFIPSDEKILSKINVLEIGRTNALTAIFKDALAELPNTYQCRGPVESYPTCCYQSFGSYFSAALSSLPRELDVLFDSAMVKTEAAVEKALEVIIHLVELLDAGK